MDRALYRLLMAACVMWLAGWVVVFIWPGSEVGGLAVYFATGLFVLLGAIALARLATRGMARWTSTSK